MLDSLVQGMVVNDSYVVFKSVLSSLPLLLPIVGGFYFQWRKLQGQDDKLDTIHVLVNSRLTEALLSITELQHQLENAGMVPNVDKIPGPGKLLPTPIVVPDLLPTVKKGEP